MGFTPFADERHASRSVTSIRMPDELEWRAFDAELRSRGLVLAGGQGKLSGRIFRIGHLGDCSIGDIVRAIEVIEQGAAALGLQIESGAGPAAARSAGKSHAAASQPSLARAGV